MNKKAVTLMEIIVSTILVALVMAGLVGLFVTGKSYVMHSRSRISAGELAKAFLDPLQMDVNAATWGSNCLKGDTGCLGAKTINGITYTPNYTITDVAGTNLRRAQVEIKWTENQP